MIPIKRVMSITLMSAMIFNSAWVAAAPVMQVGGQVELETYIGGKVEHRNILGVQFVQNNSSSIVNHAGRMTITGGVKAKTNVQGGIKDSNILGGQSAEYNMSSVVNGNAAAAVIKALK